MRIEQSNVSLFSSHKKSTDVTDNESFEQWENQQNRPKRADRVVLSDDYKHLNKAKSLNNVCDDEEIIDPKLMSIILAIEALTGKKIDISFFKKASLSNTTVQDLNVNSATESSNLHGVTDSNDTVTTTLGWGIRYTNEHHEITDEFLAFSASGHVKSQDGKSIEFSLALEMSSHTELHESINFVAGDAKIIDPLVLNFGTDTVTLSDVKKDFDLDMDGKSDTFSFVGEGSGFLALDKNSDGIINNGSELFGPTKGNGFEELSAYDSDNNGWIDENDEVFNSLVIWTKDELGNENLYSLKDKNVGALYLGRADTQFDLKDNSDNVQAFLKESSLYLKEDGSGAGTLQEVDLLG